jgi:membrane protease YdiL (CAAX protease family)
MPPVYTVGFILFSFILYQLLADSPFLRKLFGWPAEHNTRILFGRMVGFIVLGATGLLIEAKKNYSGISGLMTPEFQSAFYWILLGLPLIFLINILFTYPDGTDKYPQLKYDTWHAGHFVLNSITWLIYLFSYEWLLRGELLPELVSLTGVWLGIAVNTIIYSLVHTVKGRREMIASIPVGIILCTITLYTHSFLAAFIFHGVFALTYEYVLLYRQVNPRYKSVQQ